MIAGVIGSEGSGLLVWQETKAHPEMCVGLNSTWNEVGSRSCDKAILLLEDTVLDSCFSTITFNCSLVSGRHPCLFYYYFPLCLPKYKEIL